MEKYDLIGKVYLLNIEKTIFETSTQRSPYMKEYYYYWERRIYNALVKMILRALLSLKNLMDPKIDSLNQDKVPALFYVKADYNYPDVNIVPQRTECSH